MSANTVKSYKTEQIAKQQASKKFGKDWGVNYLIQSGPDGFTIVEKLPEAPAEVELETESVEPVAEQTEPEAPAAPSMLASLVGNMLNPETIPQAPAAPKKEAEKTGKTGKTVEQNRPEQNGLKRPSAGSTCAIIWDTCDRITSETEHTCTSAELFNALQGYNECTLRTQYARWRQFNGITGRLPNQQKQTKLPAEWQDAIDTLMDKIQEDKVDAIKALETCKSPTDLVAWIAHNAVNF